MHEQYRQGIHCYFFIWDYMLSLKTAHKIVVCPTALCWYLSKDTSPVWTTHHKCLKSFKKYCFTFLNAMLVTDTGNVLACWPGHLTHISQVSHTHLGMNVIQTERTANLAKLNPLHRDNPASFVLWLCSQADSPVALCRRVTKAMTHHCTDYLFLPWCRSAGRAQVSPDRTGTVYWGWSRRPTILPWFPHHTTAAGTVAHRDNEHISTSTAVLNSPADVTPPGCREDTEPWREEGASRPSSREPPTLPPPPQRT